MKRLTIIAAVASVGITALFFVLLLKPKMSAIEETKKQVEAARSTADELRNDIRQLEEARKNAPTLLARLDKLTRLLPPEPDLPGFIRIVQGAAERSGVDLHSIAPSTPQDLQGAEGVSIVSVTLTISGTFRRVEDFLSRLETLERVVEVRNVVLSPTTDETTGMTSLQGTLGLQMYVVGPNATLAPAAAGGGS